MVDLKKLHSNLETYTKTSSMNVMKNSIKLLNIIAFRSWASREWFPKKHKLFGLQNSEKMWKIYIFCPRHVVVRKTTPAINIYNRGILILPTQHKALLTLL